MVAWPLVYGGVAAAAMAADALYRYWRDEDDVEAIKPQEINVPHVEDGSAIPLIFGRVRVRKPILAWSDVPETEPGSVGNGWPVGQVIYRFSMFYVCGIGMNEGNGTNGFHNIWAGEQKFSVASTSVAAGAALTQAELPVTAGEEGPIGGQFQWYDGNSAQEHVDSGGSAVTALGLHMLTYWPAASIPGFRGYISTYLTNNLGQWYLGPTPTVQAYSFEVSSYVDDPTYPVNSIFARIGEDVNPVNALYDLLKCYLGKLGIPTSYIDMTSFTAAAMTCYQESHGYSRCMENPRTGVEYILELLKQIDGVLYEDMTSGTLKLKLIRNDYVVGDLPEINRSTAVDLVGFAAGGWSGLPNWIRVKYPKREDGYRDATDAEAKNPANAVGQDNQVRVQLLDFPGVHYFSLAYKLAWRELAWRSRPVMKCRAILDRSFVRLNPGDPVLVSWTNPDLSRVVFRVVAVDRGTLTDGKIAVDLIQDAGYTYRQIAPLPGGLDRSDLGIDLGGLGLGS